jgi:hypothetical protein
MLAIALPAAAGAETTGKVVHRLTGTWRLLSFVSRGPEGTTYPFGRDAVGKLTYTRDRQVWALVARRGASKNLPDALWYTGTFAVKLKTQTVHHRVAYSAIAAWEGTDLVRGYRFHGSHRLTLTVAPSSPGGATGILEWRKVGR